MAKKGIPQNGRDRLDEAMALLIQNQAAFVGCLSESDRQRLKMEHRHLEFERETAERFARIERDMASILRVLSEHGRILEAHGRLLEQLPEAVRDKIGFKRQE